MRSILAELSDAPAVATRHVVAAATGWLYLIGGIISGLALIASRGAVEHPGVVFVLVLCAVGAGTVVLRVGDRMPRWWFHVLVVSATALISVGILAAGRASSAVGFAALYIFIAMDGFFFFSWKLGVAHLATAVGAAAAVLTAIPGVPTGAVIVVTGVCAVVATIVGWLVRAAAAVEMDPLTGLANRRAFERILADDVDRAVRTGEPLAVAFVDVGAAPAAAGPGHPTGDKVLRSLSRRWSSLLSPTDLLTRGRGDEFALVLRGRSAAEATTLVEGMVAAAGPVAACSAGVAEFGVGESADTLVRQADDALFRAKRAGANATVLLRAPSRPETSRLAAALRAGHFFLDYQPVVDLTSGALVGVEALARCRDGDGGLVPPTAFVPIAERSDMIHDLGRWALTTACRQLTRWQDEGLDLDKLCVNVSVRQFDRPHFADDVLQILAACEADPRKIVLEVTESSLESSPRLMETALSRLRGEGIRVAVDDFGTGYSSLSRLDQLPVDILKIDRSFVAGIGSGAGDPLVAAIVALAGALGLAVVPEGVETEEQAGYLRSQGCTEAQGFLFGRPVAPDLLTAWPRGAAPDTATVPEREGRPA